MQRQIERITDWDERSTLVALAIGVFTLPPEASNDIDAIVVYPGQGEIERVTHAIDRWQRPARARYFLMPGVNTSVERMERPLTRKRFMELGMTDFAGVVVREFATNTLEETRWVVAQARALKVTSIGLTTAGYHLLRAYLVLVQALLRADLWIPVVPLPTAMPLHQVSPENGVSMWNLIPGEIERIARYGAQGHVALLPELQRYMEWLWKQPIITKYTARKTE